MPADLMAVCIRAIELLAPCIATAALAWIGATRKARKADKQELLDLIESNTKGTKGIIRMLFIDVYEKHVIDKRPMSIETKQEIENLWDAYHNGMGGNGTIQPLYDALHNVEPYIVRRN